MGICTSIWEVIHLAHISTMHISLWSCIWRKNPCTCLSWRIPKRVMQGRGLQYLGSQFDIRTKPYTPPTIIGTYYSCFKFTANTLIFFCVASQLLVSIIFNRWMLHETSCGANVWNFCCTLFISVNCEGKCASLIRSVEIMMIIIRVLDISLWSFILS